MNRREKKLLRELFGRSENRMSRLKKKILRELRETAFMIFLMIFLLYSAILFIVLLLGVALTYAVMAVTEWDVKYWKKIWPKTNTIMNHIVEMLD